MYRHTETGEFPITAQQIRDRHRSQASVGRTLGDDLASLLGYERVLIAARPDVDPMTHIVAAQPPEHVDGVWQQGWQVTPRPDADIAADRRVQLEARIVERCAEVEAIRDKRLQRYPHDFGGDYGLLTLQLRDSDRIAWLTLDSNASKLIAAGQGETAGLLEIRTEENITVPVHTERGQSSNGGVGPVRLSCHGCQLATQRRITCAPQATQRNGWHRCGACCWY